MEDDSKLQGLVKWGLGVVGLGAVAAAVAIPKIGIWIALVILLLALLLFGGYFLWQQRRSRRQREQFTSSIEAQTSAAPQAISDPNKRASLDKVRQKFQTGLQEFKSRGKDIYKLPWYVIIGESGSGKSEAIRHSGIDFPPGLQDEHQGSGGTVNMDWWFTNRGIILDTAGSMIFNEVHAGETPEWREFLRLLKRARPHSPVNGLFLVLSVESLIKDSSERIAQKASVLAQQLDLIQRTLDVRFPVYLLVTKCDLLTGFREFFDNIEDPLLQHQIFGWSNPDPLDAVFRPELVEQHLNTMANRVRRRRLALLRDGSASTQFTNTQQFYKSGQGTATARRLDEVDSMFALPESIMRMAPRLRRYLETIFVAGEWSAKPVFLRGIYFTSSMREGKALDEAIAFATGLSLDQLPEDRTWEKNRAFFLRDLFYEKVFRESGLVTRATNTLTLLRQRQLLIFGTAGVALLLLLVFAGFAYRSLKNSVLQEKAYWKAGATNWEQSTWLPVVTPSGDSFRFVYGGTNVVPETGNLNLTQYHQRLHQIAEKGLSVSWIFVPMKWINAGSVRDRAEAQRLLFEASVLRPLVRKTQAKMISADPPATEVLLARHREALLALMDLEADARIRGNDAIANTNRATRYLKSFLSYLTESDASPDPDLVNIFAATYSTTALKGNGGSWPPKSLCGGDSLASNPGILAGLEKFNQASVRAQTNINLHLKLVDDLTDKFQAYHQKELNWLTNTADSCLLLSQNLAPAKADFDASWRALETSTNFPSGPLTNLAARYTTLTATAKSASASALQGPVSTILLQLDQSRQGSGLFPEIMTKLNQLAGQAAETVQNSFNLRRATVNMVDANCLAPAATNGSGASYQARWSLYADACALASSPLKPNPNDVGDGWKRFADLKAIAEGFRTNLVAYKGPLADQVSARCNRIAADAEERLKGDFVDSYVKLVTNKLSELENQSRWTSGAITNTRGWLERIEGDATARAKLGPERLKLAPVDEGVKKSKANVLRAIDNDLRRTIGFPVLLDSTRAMDVTGLRIAKELLAGLSKELQNPVWQGDASGAREALQKSAANYDSVVGALAGGEGTPAEWEIWFVPPEDNESKDVAILTIFPYAVVSVGKENSPSDNLTRKEPKLLARGTVNSAVTISFRRFQKEPASEQKAVDRPDWGVVRLIRDLKAERRQDGLVWRFKVELQDKQQNLSGNVTFEAHMKRPLPKLEDWPKQ